MTAAEEAKLDDPAFLGCGFAFIGAWGRRPAGSIQIQAGADLITSP